MKTKVCNKCKQENSVDEFYVRKDTNNGNGVSPCCRICDSQRKKIWKLNNPEKHRNSQQKSDKKRYPIKKNVRYERRSWALYTLGGECVDGGLKYNGNNSNSFDIHHLDPSKREFKISGSKLDKSLESLKKELDKCVLLCSKCHKQRHLDYNNGLRETL